MVSFVMCPLVVVPAVVGYYYGKHAEQELRDQEQEALWLGKEETLKDYVAHSYAPPPRVAELQQQPQQQEEEEQQDAQPREPVEQHQEGEGLCREASAVETAQVASVAAVAAATAETRDVTVPGVQGTQVDELTLASEMATEELAKLSSAAVAASDLCRTSFVKAVDGAAQELRRLEQAARTQFDSCGVLLGETTCLPSTTTLTTTTTTTTTSALPSSSVTSMSPSSLPLFNLQNDVTSTFRTLWSQDEETKELPHQDSSPEQEEEQDDDDISLLHFEMLKNPTMDDNLLNKENHDIDTILPRKVTVQAVNKSIRDIELTLKTMTSPSLVEI